MEADDFESRVTEEVESRLAEAVESRIAEAVESRLAEAVEKHNQVTRLKTIEMIAIGKSMKRKALHMEGLDYFDRRDNYEVVMIKHNQALREKAMERMMKLQSMTTAMERNRSGLRRLGSDFIDRGDYYEVAIKGTFINTEGRVGAVHMESLLKEDYILFSGVPPITVKYPKIPIGGCFVSNLKAMQDFWSNMMTQVAQNIREAPKEIHAAYRQAYYKAIEEYDQRLKNKSPSDQDEEIEKIRDEQLRLARIKADKIIRDEQIMADQIRASCRKTNIGNQSGRVDPQTVNVDLAAMLNVKGTFKESDIEKLISKRQAAAQLMAETCIDTARINADRIIEYNKALKRQKNHRGDPGEARKFDQAMLGFKVSDETQRC